MNDFRNTDLIDIRPRVSNYTVAESNRSPLEFFTPRSDSSSLKILMRDGGNFWFLFTENASPFGTPGVWYGSWPIIITFTLFNSHKSKALKKFFGSGKTILPSALSEMRWSFIFLK